MTISWESALRRVSLIAFLAIGLAVLAPMSASSARQDVVVQWVAPTPPEGAVLGISAKTQLAVSFAASTPGGVGVTVRIRATSAVPAGGSLKTTDGNPGRATFLWTPNPSQAGEYRVTFTATSDLPGTSAERTIVIRVGSAGKPPPGPPPPPGVFPKRSTLSDRATETYRWAFVRKRTVARTGPSRSTRAIATVTFRTPELYRNAIMVLNSVQYRNGETWLRIRLTVLPNGRTGWVRRGSLAAFQQIHTRMVISHRSLRATLYRYGKKVFSTRVGVGQSQWPTPRGEFYVREKLSGYYAPAYGPRAFGLNARSTKLTDWPGGGFIGIHGTNQPNIIPGRISHGCVRVRNAAILRLFRLMPIGTPVTIT